MSPEAVACLSPRGGHGDQKHRSQRAAAVGVRVHGGPGPGGQGRTVGLLLWKIVGRPLCRADTELSRPSQSLLVQAQDGKAGVQMRTWPRAPASTRPAADPAGTDRRAACSPPGEHAVVHPHHRALSSQGGGRGHTPRGRPRQRAGERIWPRNPHGPLMIASA